MGCFSREPSPVNLTRLRDIKRRRGSRASQGQFTTVYNGGPQGNRPYGLPKQGPPQPGNQYQILDHESRDQHDWEEGPNGMRQRDERETRGQSNSLDLQGDNPACNYSPQPNNTTLINNLTVKPGGNGNNSETVRDKSATDKVISTPLSFRSLQDEYNKSIENSEFQSRYSNIISYVQDLLTQNCRLESRFKEKDKELEQVFDGLLRLIRSIYPADVETQRESGLAGDQILQFVHESYLNNSNKVISLTGRIAAANQAVHIAEKNLEQQVEFRRKEQYQHSQAIEEREKSHLQTLKDQERDHEIEIELKQHAYTQDITRLKTSHKQEIDSMNALHTTKIENLKAGHITEIQNQTTSWNSKVAKLEATISHLQVALIPPIDYFEPLMDSDAENRLEGLRHLVRALSRTSMEGVEPYLLGEAFGQISFIQSGKKQGRKYILESVLWEILMDSFFAHPFSMFGDHGILLSKTWRQLFETDFKQNSNGYLWPIPTESSENWRYTTCEALQRALTKPNFEKYIKQSHETHLVTVADNLAGAIKRVSPNPVISQVEHIVDRANSLALKFSIQRCRLQLFIMNSGDSISTSVAEMYDVLNPMDIENAVGGMVALAVMPGLKKTGDAKGGSLNKVSVIRPAAVYLKTWP
ncbi:hypothetical protein BGZ60DRAFT_428983 [Tricladium varicosporioides]|nr:hypothetical protein BGZ60DRAFT_428983 [Hymenoscyphus varicosporioides]